MGEPAWRTMLAAARQAWGDGHAHDALQLCDRAALLTPPARYGAAMLRGDILLDLGDAAGALSSYESVADPRTADPLLDCARGLALFELVRFPEAENALHSALRGDDTLADAHFALGLMAELTGSGQEGEHFRRARKLAPERFPARTSLPGAEFESAVEEALESLPERVQEAMHGTPVLIAELPRLDDLRRAKSPISPQSLGTFVGLLPPHGDVAGPGDELPRRAILLFKRNLERACAERAALVREIADTLEEEAVAGFGLAPREEVET